MKHAKALFQMPSTKMFESVVYGGIASIIIFMLTTITTMGEPDVRLYQITSAAPVVLAILYAILLFLYEGLRAITTSASIQSTVKEHNIPAAFTNWLVFLTVHKKQMPYEWQRYYEAMKQHLFNHPESVQIASSVFLDQQFLEAFSKLDVLCNDEVFQYRFQKSMEMEDEGLQSLLKQTVIDPIEETMKNYFLKQAEYQKLMSQTHINAVKSLLVQDFTKVYPVQSLPEEETNLYPYEILSLNELLDTSALEETKNKSSIETCS